MTTELSTHQREIFGAALKRIQDGEMITSINGAAGTGKTTLARVFQHHFNRVVYLALAGKAVDVLRKKGCHNASTIHSAIYTPEVDNSCVKRLESERDEAYRAVPKDIVRYRELVLELKKAMELGWALRDPETAPISTCQLIVIDESSMLTQELMADIRRFGVPIVATGDSHQLPPVGGDAFFHRGYEFDLRLTEIHRQARDNPILHAATLVRQNKAEKIETGVKTHETGTLEKVHIPRFGKLYGFKQLREFVQEQYERFDGDVTFISGMHLTRIHTTRAIRQLLGYDNALPQAGEPILCRSNRPRHGLYNGVMLRATRNGRFAFKLRRRDRDATEDRYKVDQPVIDVGLDRAGLLRQVFLRPWSREPHGKVPTFPEHWKTETAGADRATTVLRGELGKLEETLDKVILAERDEVNQELSEGELAGTRLEVARRGLDRNLNLSDEKLAEWRTAFAWDKGVDEIYETEPLIASHGIPVINARFGYCLTAHSAQGSEYDNVVVLDDGLWRGWGRDDPTARARYADDRRRWCYTAYTRAKKHLVIATPFTRVA